MAELASGGRVPTIAKELSISPATIRNHLQRIFWKLGVHSQAELIEYTRRFPEALGELCSAGKSFELSQAETKYWQANERLAAEINSILERQWGPGALREVFHRSLPLAERSREEWRARIAFWAHRPAPDSELAAKRKAEMETWKGEATIRLAQAQQEGWLRSDIPTSAILEQLFSLMVGVATQLVADPTSKRADLVRVIDAYADDLLTVEPVDQRPV